MVSQAKNRSPPPRNGHVIRGRQLELDVVEPYLPVHLVRATEADTHMPVLRCREPQQPLPGWRSAGYVTDDARVRFVGVMHGNNGPARLIGSGKPSGLHGQNVLGTGLQTFHIEPGERSKVLGRSEQKTASKVPAPLDPPVEDLIRLSPGGHAPRVREQIHAKNLFGGHATTPSVSPAGRASCRNRTTACSGCRPRTPPGACPTWPG